MAEVKEMKQEAMNQNEEQNQGTPAPEAPVEKKDGKIKTFFKTHGGKIKMGLGLAGALGVGIAADRLGLKLGGKKKDEDGPTEAAE